jgi:hypothetical protein
VVASIVQEGILTSFSHWAILRTRHEGRSFVGEIVAVAGRLRAVTFPRAQPQARTPRLLARVLHDIIANARSPENQQDARNRRLTCMFRWLRRPGLEIHVPISPTPVFLNMVHYLAHSLRMFGGKYRHAPIIVTIGAERVDEGLEHRLRWMKELNVVTRWLPVELFTRDSYYATAMERFRYSFGADMVLMLDADVLIRRPFDELIEQARRRKCISGLLAHVSPFERFERWQMLYDACGLGRVEAPHEHTGFGLMFHEESRRYCPPYFNFGVVCAPGDVMTRVGRVMYDLMYKVDSIIQTVFRCQLALSLAITKLGLPYSCIPMRYNFANDPDLERGYDTEMRNAAILHLLRNHQFYKLDLFRSLSGIEELLTRPDLTGINAMAQNILRRIHPLVRAQQQECAA